MVQKIVTLKTTPEDARQTGTIDSLIIVDDDPGTPHAILHNRPEPWIVTFTEEYEYVLILKSHFPDATQVTVNVGEQKIVFEKQSNNYFGGLRHIHL
ncbi:hypothetical protein [Alteromonas lipotrueae]|uniref:hypothetical protein n=1 Tax=Alteromonas lipotrueae TaxID=2803814 RepID=UPI001C485027|nr:hypothetical protein [Alteromonas lipotrueae]